MPTIERARRLPRSAIIALVTFATVASASAQESTTRRSIPRTTREALLGGAPARALLGAPRRSIEAGRTPSGEEAGWVRYGADLAIRYEAEIAMRVRARVGATSCEEAARSAGFELDSSTAPLRRRDSCEWPGVSARHQLAPGIAGRYEAGVLEIWLR